MSTGINLKSTKMSLLDRHTFVVGSMPQKRRIGRSNVLLGFT